MDDRANLFTGKAGEHAVASQLLVRQWQVAIPEVDVGDDLLAHQDLTRVLRVQVKTSRAVEQKRSYVGHFKLSLAQLATPRTPELLYVFAVFRDRDWSDFVVAPRADLYDEYALHHVGSTYQNNVNLRLRFDETTLVCSKRDWTRYRGNWP